MAADTQQNLGAAQILKGSSFVEEGEKQIIHKVPDPDPNITEAVNPPVLQNSFGWSTLNIFV